MLGNAFLLAFRQIRRNPLRSLLTVLGIVIGVAAVITMVTVGNGQGTDRKFRQQSADASQRTAHGTGRCGRRSEF